MGKQSGGPAAAHHPQRHRNRSLHGACAGDLCFRQKQDAADGVQRIYADTPDDDGGHNRNCALNSAGNQHHLNQSSRAAHYLAKLFFDFAAVHNCSSL